MRNILTPARAEAPKAQSAASQVPQTGTPHAPQGTDVVMPQMGESIFEGTITRWLKKAGDPVQKVPSRLSLYLMAPSGLIRWRELPG